MAYRATNPLVKQNDLNRNDLDDQLEAMFKDSTLLDGVTEGIKSFKLDDILEGKVTSIGKDEVVVDIGYKAEGFIDTHEWYEEEKHELEEMQVGDTLEVLIDAFDEDAGIVILSKKKADRIRAWERVMSQFAEGSEVEGTVTKKIKGGLLVDIGVPAFLPASQVDIRRVKDVNDYIGQVIDCMIIKIDEDRMNIVVSRRKLMEHYREILKEQFFKEAEEGQVREGVVKNIAEFGAFVDLGGIDGLLHITDMSWGRVSHPTEVVEVDQKVEVKILKIDRERERIALGLKQLSASPWENIDTKYPVGAKVRGAVVNVMSYGAFVKLEDGIEGLVHISEMSWTKRVQHPSELVKKGDEVDVVVLQINKDKEEISLGMKQVQDNPWNTVAEKYPVNSVIRGKVRNLTTYGAFVELEEGIDGLLHVSDMSWTKKVAHPSELFKKGDEVECMVLSVDVDKKRIALGYKQLHRDPWEADIPNKFYVGSVSRGHITKLTNFGVFVELEQGLEGLLHISELSAGMNRKIQTPEEVVKVGQELDVKIIRVDPRERKIGLSLALPLEEQEPDEKRDAPSEAATQAAAEEAAAPDSGSTAATTAAPSQPAPQAGQTALGAQLADLLEQQKKDRDDS